MYKHITNFLLALLAIFIFASENSFSQATHDPASLPVYEASGPITVDGVLNEPDWLTRAPQLKFMLGVTPSELNYTPTNDSGLIVKDPYTDTSTCYVKFLHYNNILYVSLQSNDKQVGIFDWEGDGMFMKIKNGLGQESEFKLYVIRGTNSFGAETGGAAIPSGAYGGTGVVNGTVMDSTDTDNGYTAEGFIDLSQLFDTVPSTLEILVNIFDPDYYTAGSPWGFGGYGSFAKQWWGSEWGGTFRNLVLKPNKTPFDPASLPVFKASGPITVDGILNEFDWSVDKPNLMFKLGGMPTGLSYAPTNSGIVIKPPYTDTSTCYVKFLHYNNILYVSLQSNDKQVGIFDWEGDGMFMKIKNGLGQESEFKLYVIRGTNSFGAETGGAAIPSGAYGGTGVVNGTVMDSTDTDNGYTAEGFIDLSQLFDTVPSTLEILVNIFDPDYYTAGSPWGFGGYGSFAKQWWGSEWGGTFRNLVLSNTVVPVELASFTSSVSDNNVTLNWVTATELNNRGFEIFRSTSDSKDWTNIASVEGKGTTSETNTYSITDKNLPSGKYNYRLEQIDFDGTRTVVGNLTVNVGVVVGDFVLEQNYPNPFNPSTSIKYNIPEQSTVKLSIVNILGQVVTELLNEVQTEGYHSKMFDASQLSSGIYFAVLKASSLETGKVSTQMIKMVYMK